MVSSPPLSGRRVFITGAARGIGAALAQRLHERGAKVALAGLEPDILADTAAPLDAPWWACDVTDRDQVDETVDRAVDALGGLDVVVANAGVAAQMPVVGGDPTIFERTVAVNLVGSFFTLRAAGPHISHRHGYAVVVSSVAAAVHLPLLAAYNASKAGIEAVGNTLRSELAPTGARVGVAYFAELDTDMTRRGFGTEAAARFLDGRTPTGVTPLVVGINALERGIARRSRRIVAPAYMAPVLFGRMAAQRVVDRFVRDRVTEALAVARDEQVDLTTPQ